MTRHGSYPHGENHANAKLTALDVRTIRQRRKAGDLLKVLAAEYHVDQSYVSRLVMGHYWKHLGKGRP